MPVGANYLRRRGWDDRSINILGYIFGIIGIIIMFIGIALLSSSYETSLGLVL